MSACFSIDINSTIRHGYYVDRRCRRSRNTCYIHRYGGYAAATCKRSNTTQAIVDSIRTRSHTTWYYHKSCISIYIRLIGSRRCSLYGYTSYSSRSGTNAVIGQYIACSSISSTTYRKGKGISISGNCWSCRWRTYAGYHYGSRCYRAVAAIQVFAKLITYFISSRSHTCRYSNRTIGMSLYPCWHSKPSKRY